MTIKLAAGFVSIKSNSELVKPFRDLEKDGTPVVLELNKSRVLLPNALRRVNERDLPVLGMPFVAGTYMIVDHECRQLRFGQPSRTMERPKKENLVPILPPGKSCNALPQDVKPVMEEEEKIDEKKSKRET